MSREKHDEPREVHIRASVTYCGDCGRSHILDLHESIKHDLVKQARWWDGWAELSHGGWLCEGCITGHADHTLRESAEIVRESHTKTRVDGRWSTQTVRGR
jgi:hypothetical protein